LVDIDGNVVGINTLMLSEGGGSEGWLFAIPASIVNLTIRASQVWPCAARCDRRNGTEYYPTLAVGRSCEELGSNRSDHPEGTAKQRV